MGKLNTVNITMDEIHQEIGGTANSSCSLNDGDIRGMAAPDINFAGADGINDANNSTISIGEFRNGEHTSFGPWSGMQWDTTQIANVSSGSYMQAQAFCQIAFANDNDNNRVIVSYYGGTNAAMATVYTTYVPYTGKPAANPVKVMYTYPSTWDGGFLGPGSLNPLLSIGTSFDYPYQSYGWPGHPSQSTSASIYSSTHKKDSGAQFDLSNTGQYVPYKYFLSTNTDRYGTQMLHLTHYATWTLLFTAADSSVVSTTFSQGVYLQAAKGPIF